MLRNLSNIFSLCALAAYLYVSPTGAQPSIGWGDGCPDPAMSDFNRVNLVTDGLSEPVHIAVAPDGRVFIAEMKSGNIKVYTPGQTGTQTVGQVDVRFSNEDGMLGVALDPDFAANHFLYVFYTRPSGGEGHELSRFTLTGGQMTDRALIMSFDRVDGGMWHAAGGMAWDGDGNLIIGTGDDTNPHGGPNDGYGPIYTNDPVKDAQKSSSNTNDLRGKVLRIKPIPFASGETPSPGVGSTYAIPPGNLFDEAQDTGGKTRPEIYAMGCRNPYKVAADPVTNWVFWGDVGPDAGAPNDVRGPQGHDELNLATTAGFFGHPYFNADNKAYNEVIYQPGSDNGTIGEKYNPQAPYNTSPNNTGLRDLPPARPPLIWYSARDSYDFDVRTGCETAIGGAVYRYDTGSQSPVKFPPYYDGRLFWSDWCRRFMRVATVSPEGMLTKEEVFGNDDDTKSIIDMKFGTDGALYVLKYSNDGYGDKDPELYRIEYTGAIDETCFNPPVSRAGNPRAPRLRPGGIGWAFTEGLRAPEGATHVMIYDLDGRLLVSRSIAPDSRGWFPLSGARLPALGVIRYRFAD